MSANSRMDHRSSRRLLGIETLCLHEGAHGAEVAVGAAEAAQVRGIRIQEKGATGASHGGGG